MAKEKSLVDLRSNLESLKELFQSHANRTSDLNHALAALMRGWPHEAKHDLPYWFLLLHYPPKEDALSIPIHVIGLVSSNKTQRIHLCQTLYGSVADRQVEDFKKLASDAFGCVVQAREYIKLPYGLKLTESVRKWPQQHYLRWLTLLHLFSCLENSPITLKSKPSYFTDDNEKQVAALLEGRKMRRNVDWVDYGDFEKRATEKLDTWASRRLGLDSKLEPPGYFAPLQFDVFTSSVEVINLLLATAPAGISKSDLWWDIDGQPHWGDRIVVCTRQMKEVLAALCKKPVSPIELARLLVPAVHNDTKLIKRVLVNSGRRILTFLRVALWDAGMKCGETKTDLIQLRDYQGEKKYTLALNEDQIRKRLK